MSLGRLLRRASSKASDLLTLTPGGGSSSVLDGEIIYSKNNVCVHPPELLQGSGEHHPGDGVLQTVPTLSFSLSWVLFLSSSTPWALKKLRGASGGQGKAVLWKAKESHPQADLSVLLSVGRLVILLLSLLVQHGFTWFSKSFCTVRSCHLRTVTSVARSCP